MPSAAIQLGIKASALSDDAHAAAVEARRMGFAGLLFDAFAPSLSIPDLSLTGRREFRHVLSSQDQQLVGLSADLGKKGLLPGADVDRILKNIDRLFESAAGLMAPLVCLDVGPLPEPPRTVKPRPKVTPQQAGLILLPESFALSEKDNDAAAQSSEPPPDPAWVAQTDAGLIEIGLRADRFNVTVALRTDLASFAALDSALRRAACPWFGIDLDPASILADKWSIDEILSALGAQVRHVRGRGAVKGADRRTKPAVVGEGDTDWPQLLASLDAAGYRGWLTVDPVELNDRPSAARRAQEHLSAAMKR